MVASSTAGIHQWDMADSVETLPPPIAIGPRTRPPPQQRRQQAAHPDAGAAAVGGLGACIGAPVRTPVTRDGRHRQLGERCGVPEQSSE